MPLPSVLNGAKQCQVLTKRTKQQCKNPAAYNCVACRMHGAHKSRNVLQDKNHPMYKHGKKSKKTIQNYQNKLLNIFQLENICYQIKLISDTTPKIRGKKPNGWKAINLNNPVEMKKVIFKLRKRAKKVFSQKFYC